MKTRTRVALAAVAALVSGQAFAEMTPYFRLNNADNATAPSASPSTGSPGAQPAAQMTVGTPTSRTAYTGTGFSQPAPSVDNATAPLTWQLLSGGQDVSSGFQAVCPGLGFSGSDGSISGSPTQACAPTLQYKVTSVPTGGGTPATALSALFALNVLTPVVDVTPPSTSVKSGAPLTVTATTNLANPTWSVSGNPSWMPFTASGQSYSFSGTAGTVSSTQYSTLVITASSGGASPSGTAYVTVEPAQQAQTGFPSGMTVRANKPMSIALADPRFASETWTATDNQQSVANLAISGGNLTGTPNGGFTSVAPTPYAYTTFINATSNKGTKYTGQLSVKPPITFGELNNTAARNGSINQPLSYQPTLQNGIGAITYTLLYPTSMPTGMGFNAATGEISGTPSVFGQYIVGVLATDAYDNTTTQVQLNLNITLPQDIAFNGKTSSANYVYAYGPVSAGTSNYVDVVLRNVTSKQVSLKLATANGDSSSTGAFSILVSQTSNGRGGFVDTTANSYVPEYGGSEAYNYGSSTPGAYCAQYLKPGYYCKFRLVYKSATTGTKNGTFTIQTENNTSAIPLTLTVQ